MVVVGPKKDPKRKILRRKPIEEIKIERGLFEFDS